MNGSFGSRTNIRETEGQKEVQNNRIG